MQDDEDRYTRQRRLREIGEAGQERLLSAKLTLAGGDAALVELVYLHRAGVGSVTLDALGTARPFAHRGVFRHAASLRHASGAWRALRTVVELVGADASRVERKAAAS
jgi:hypothetical protein